MIATWVTSHPAVRLITQTIDGFDPGKVRSRGFAQLGLADAHLIGRDYEHAAAIGRDAIRTATQLGSTKTVEHLRTLQRCYATLRMRMVASFPVSTNDPKNRA